MHEYTCEYCTGDGRWRPEWQEYRHYEEHMRDRHIGLPYAPPMADWATHSHKDGPADTRLREAAQEAVAAFDRFYGDYGDSLAAIDRLRAALAAPLDEARLVDAYRQGFAPTEGLDDCMTVINGQQEEMDVLRAELRAANAAASMYRTIALSAPLDEERLARALHLADPRIEGPGIGHDPMCVVRAHAIATAYRENKA